MPNYVSNIVKFYDKDNKQIEGEILKSIFERYSYKGNDFDFNKIIPMPEELNVTAGSATEEAIAYYATKKGTEDYSVEDRKLLSPVLNNMFDDAFMDKLPERAKQTIKEYPEKEKEKEYLEVGEKAYNNVLKYGSYSWYEWCIKNWGTKWNSCESEVFDESIFFLTAWSCPLPIYEALSKNLKDITIEVYFEDEDFGSNLGKFKILNGDYIYENFPESCSKEAYELLRDEGGYDDDSFANYGIFEKNDGNFFNVYIGDNETPSYPSYKFSYEGEDIEGIIIPERIPVKERLNVFNYYELRSGEGSEYSTLEPSVKIDFAGTFMTLSKINFKNRKDSYVDISKIFTAEPYKYSLSEYLKKY